MTAHALPAAPPPDELAQAQAEQRQRAARTLSTARLSAALLFCALAGWSYLVSGAEDWRPVFRDLLLYSAAAGVVWAAARRGIQPWIAATVPLCNVLAVFALQHHTQDTSPIPAGVAGWTLGPMVLLLLISSLTSPPKALAGAAALAFVCEGALQHAAGVRPPAIVASALVLGAAAFVTVYWTRVRDRLAHEASAREVARLLSEARSRDAEARREELHRQHDALQKAQREAEALVNFLVHDMRGPLGGIRALLSLAKDLLARGAPESELLDKADELSQRLLGMVGDLLTIARLESGGPLGAPSTCMAAICSAPAG
jgi:signal transduction histidine kinase